MNFIENRLNKDNFWNLMFWLLMTANMSLVDFFTDFIPILSLIFFLGSFFVIPYILVKFNGVKYQGNKTFTNKKDKLLNTSYIKYFGFLFILNIPVSLSCLFVIDKNLPQIKDLICIYTSIFLIVPVSYFILINCPISIIFNRKAWQQKIFGIHLNNGFAHNISSSQIDCSMNHKPVSSLSPSEWSTSPAYSSLSSNIHHRR